MQNYFCILVENKQPCVWCVSESGGERERDSCVCVCVFVFVFVCVRERERESCVCVCVPRHAFCERLVTDTKHLRVTHSGMHVNV
jgi:hypothetical protein